jgi:anti-sigma regulatory factor (Ser/Thr protein kinase)
VTSTTCLDLRLPAVPSSVQKARDAVAAVVSNVLRRKRVADDARLCVSEAVTNVVRHAYGREGGDVEIVVERENDEVSVVVRDDGRGMTKAEREGRVGGFGLKIIAKLADRYRITTTPNAGVEVEMVFGERKRATAPGRVPIARRRAQRTRRSAAA